MCLGNHPQSFPIQLYVPLFPRWKIFHQMQQSLTQLTGKALIFHKARILSFTKSLGRSKIMVGSVMWEIKIKTVYFMCICLSTNT